MSDDGTNLNQLTKHLIATLKADGFALFAQAIAPIDPKSDARLFQEVLVRMREEEEKMLPPGSFFPMLEEHGLIPYVDRWVVSRIATTVKAQRAKMPDWVAPRHGINLGDDTLKSDSFAEFVLRQIEENFLPHGTLTFEFSWDTALDHAEALLKFKEQVEEAGCGFTLARFDGSDESFERLEALKPHFLKLGYGVVKDIERALSGLERAEAIVSRCHDLGIKVIAEFIEDRDLIEHLRTMGVDYSQGLAISAPMPLR